MSGSIVVILFLGTVGWRDVVTISSLMAYINGAVIGLLLKNLKYKVNEANVDTSSSVESFS
jgi:hypothetical protein